MNTFILRYLSSFLALIGLLIGFTSKVMAQYGAPPSSFKITGKIKSAETSKPIPNIQVSLLNSEFGNKIFVKSDSLGRFNIKTRSYSIDNDTLVLKAEDIDGALNGGYFNSDSKNIIFSDYKKNEVDFTLKNGEIPTNIEPSEIPIFDMVILSHSIKGQFTVEYNVPKADPITFIVYNDFGSEIYNKKIEINNTIGKYIIKLNNPLNGDYSICLIQNAAIISKKITIE